MFKKVSGFLLSMWLGFILLWFSWLILQHSTFFTTYFCTTKIQYIYNEILLSNKKNERFPFTAAYLKLPQYCKSTKVQFKNKKESLIDEVIDKETGPERRSDPAKVTAELGPDTIFQSYQHRMTLHWGEPGGEGGKHGA